jgi:hypothetical protein
VAVFLVRDFDKDCGYIEREGELPRNRNACYVPWAITDLGKVVYAPIEASRGKPSNPGLKVYDSQVSKARRKLCHTELGLIALQNPDLSRTAVTKVTSGVCWFLFRRLRDDPKIRETFRARVGKYLYGTSYMSFGRLSDGDAPEEDAVWNQALATLRKGAPIESILNIHDGVGRGILGQGDSEHASYSAWADKLRADAEGEFINEKWRGRQKKEKTEYKPTSVPGNLSSEVAVGMPTVQAHNRGVDMYSRIAPSAPPEDSTVRPEASGNVYFEQLDLRNELFGAGPSGTTGTALAAAFAFGNFGSEGEDFKQYLFALIGYLIGGGNHSLHESLSVLRLIGLEYNAGTMLGYDYTDSPARTDAEGLVRASVSRSFPLLPSSFLGSQHFRSWRDNYHDVVMLGGTHWRFNCH